MWSASQLRASHGPYDSEDLLLHRAGLMHDNSADMQGDIAMLDPKPECLGNSICRQHIVRYMTRLVKSLL